MPRKAASATSTTITSTANGPSASNTPFPALPTVPNLSTLTQPFRDSLRASEVQLRTLADKIREAIDSLDEPTASDSSVLDLAAASDSTPRRTRKIGGRTDLTAAKRKAISERMKRYWAERRASEKSE